LVRRIGTCASNDATSGPQATEPDANVINPGKIMQSETDSNLHNVLLVIREPGAPLETNEMDLFASAVFGISTIHS
jgi:hypothetical protein